MVQDQYLARLCVCVCAATEEQPSCRELSPVAEPAALRDFFFLFHSLLHKTVCPCPQAHLFISHRALEFHAGMGLGRTNSITLGIRVNGVINAIEKNLLHTKKKSKYVYVMSCPAHENTAAVLGSGFYLYFSFFLTDPHCCLWAAAHAR